MTTLNKLFADLIEQARAAPRDIAEGAAQELIDAARGAGFQIDPPNAAEVALVRATGIVGILTAITNERVQQDEQWGGPEHDDTHALEDWLLFIEYQLERCNGIGGPEYRERMVKVAALAVAAIESWDRTYGKQDGVSTQVAGA